MAALNPLTRLSSGLLKHSAFLMGLPTTGTKAELDHAIRTRLSRGSERFKGGRIVSVDMGIRNLAYCVLDVPLADDRRQDSDLCSSDRPMELTQWSKRDLLLPTREKRNDPGGAGQEGKPTGTVDATTRGRQRKPAVKTVVSSAAFTPYMLSKTAYEVVKDLLRHKPDAILIERQRFRSGGQAAIQEWTVRVNMLESMLWACLHTLQERNDTRLGAFPTVHAVSPATVAKFWAARDNVALEPQAQHYDGSSEGSRSLPSIGMPRQKVDKKDKVAVVRSWVNSGGYALPLQFVGDAAQTAAIFQEKLDGKTRKRAIEGGPAFDKLDDLADCLLQAVAWVKWDENTWKIGRLLQQ
ncbi:hypothetical protein B0A50_04557 [Salinomyces thailandicus]|uniref:Mitochondrial resolvase Ydc2 catalytic domain-containing protein n=1 Tax=Salinomyces thailandicus TaxID=706561 RepID=A0A4U0TXM4_9PEZI|nr:hypothetical protein B0A50_04557 [Salinomyces thailandica]